MGDEFNYELYTIVPTTLYENRHYSVHPVEIREPDVFILDQLGVAYTSGYAMVSRQTGQIELIRTCLPDLLFNAEHLSNILENETYKWPEALAEMQMVKPDKVN